MLHTRSFCVRSFLAALLFTFAVTADVLVKAVVDDAGHDANNPIIWIEHKCAGHYGITTQAVLPHVTIAAAVLLVQQILPMIISTGDVIFRPDAKIDVTAVPSINLRC